MTGSQEMDILPRGIKPGAYELSIYDLNLPTDLRYSGHVRIWLQVEEATKTITLNSHKLQIVSAKISVDQSPCVATEATAYQHDHEQQRVTICFSRDVPVTSEACLDIHFHGVIRDDMAGFYRSSYVHEAAIFGNSSATPEQSLMFSTHFESCHARSAFPCFDEPNQKATFDLCLEIPLGLVALSNMPEKSTEDSERNPNRRIVCFERSPRMSTYLLTWAIGEFEYIEDFTGRSYRGKRLPVRVYTTNGLISQATFALKLIGPLLDYFSELFGIDYPLPKMDFIVVHEFSQGAMEGWGLVTFRATALLFDNLTSDSMHRTRIAYTVAHELSHQWFGNLVTMNWWNDLWLNEGFATWIGRVAVDALYPEMDIWSLFSTEGLQLALRLDALPSSHPIEVEVGDPKDVNQIFDAISYIKGAAVLRMLAAHIGIEVMIAGVSKYLKRFSFTNAMTFDLWEEISEVCGRDVSVLTDTWTKKMGFPLIAVTESLNDVQFEQSRYLFTTATQPKDDYLWWIPIGVAHKLGGVAVSLTGKRATVSVPRKSLYKLNSTNTGFFRVNYPSSKLLDYGNYLEHLSTADKIGLIADAAALAFSGHSKTSTLLDFLQYFCREQNYFVWRQIRDSLAIIFQIFGEYPLLAKELSIFVQRLVEESVNSMTWESLVEDDHLIAQRNAVVVDLAGLYGNPTIIQEAKSRFASALGTSKGAAIVLPLPLRLPILSIYIREGGHSTYEELKQQYLTTTSLPSKEILLRSLCCIQSEALLPDLFDFFLSAVPAQDLHFAAAVLGANLQLGRKVWEMVRAHFGRIEEVLRGNKVLIGGFLKAALETFASEEVAREIEEFFGGRDTSGIDRVLRNLMDGIAVRAEYRIRDYRDLADWAGSRSGDSFSSKQGHGEK